jgi:hypothetical protein
MNLFFKSRLRSSPAFSLQLLPSSSSDATKLLPPSTATMTPESSPSLETLPPELHLHTFTRLLPPTTSTLQHLHTYLTAVPIARAIWIQHRSVLLPLLEPQLEALRLSHETLADLEVRPQLALYLAVARWEVEKALGDARRVRAVGAPWASDGA